MQSLNAIAYYVSPLGNDGADGSLTQPFLTIERARDQIRSLKLSRQFNRPVYILLRGGTYSLSQTLNFSNSDSGTSQNPITYYPYQCENVTISGGMAIRGQWSVYSGNIYKINVGSLRFNSLFVNDRRAKRARIPKTGFYSPTGGSETYLNFNSGEISPTWHNLTDAEIVVNNSWEGPRFKIASVSGNTANFSGATGSGRGVGYWLPPQYFVENVFEGLEPGGWYLDNTDGSLYYWSSAGEDINSVNIVAPVMQQIVSVQGASYLNFKFLTFAHGDWSLPSGGHIGFQAGASIATLNAITFNSSTDCLFEGNTVKHLGAFAINIDNSQYIDVVGNEILDTGAGGVKIGPAGIQWGLTSMPEKYNTVTDNTIHDNNAVYREAIGGVWIMLGGYNNVDNNLIYNLSLGAVSLGWNWTTTDTSCKYNMIKDNVIRDVMQVLNDSAGIYTLGRQPGTEISGNVIHDVTWRGQRVPTNIFGLYMDEGSSQITVKNNLIYRTAYSLHLNATQGNVITNNLFIDGNTVIPLVFYKDSGSTFLRNIVYYSSQANTIGGAGWSSMGMSDYNLFYNVNKSVNAGNLVSGWPATFDQHSLFQDPMFENYALDDFTLLPQSPAFGLGFGQVDFSQAGTRAPFKR